MTIGLFWDKLNGFLAKQTDLVVVGAATDGLGVLEKCAMAEGDVALLDVSMPGMNGLKVLK